MGRDGQGCNRLSGCRARTGGCCSRRRKREESEKVASWLPGGKQRQRIRGRISHLEKKQSWQSLQIRRRGLKSREKIEAINGRGQKRSHPRFDRDLHASTCLRLRRALKIPM